MSEASKKNFVDLLAAGNTVVFSQYQDRNGYWAKDAEFVDRVKVRFNEGTVLYMTLPEVRSLTREQQAAINEAPSSETSL